MLGQLARLIETQPVHHSAGEDVIARGPAAPADLCADTTVLMVGGVTIALLRAGDTCRCAGLDGSADEADVGAALADGNARGRMTDLRAVEADSDHTGHLTRVAFAQGGVGAGGAARAAVETLLGAPKENLPEIARRLGMQVDDLPERHSRSVPSHWFTPGKSTVQRDTGRSRLRLPIGDPHSIESPPGSGARIHAEIPLPSVRSADSNNPAKRLSHG